MKVKLITAITLMSALLLFLPLAAFAAGEHEDEHPPIEVVEHAIEKLEEGEFVEAEDDLRGIVESEHTEEVNIELVRQALAALEDAEEDKAILLLKQSIEGKGGDAH
jgi:outer membrane protein assembly factor BamD (BamD/ComL family)